MDLALSEELRMLQLTARRFVQEELMPLERELPEYEDIPEELRDRFQGKVKAIGLWALDVPMEYGGAGAGVLGFMLVREELSRTSVPSVRRAIIGGSPTPLLYACKKEKADQDEDIHIAAAKVKVFADEMAGRVIDRAVQIHGAYGLTKNLPLERFYRESQHSRLGKGSMEIIRFTISRALLRD